MRNVKDPIKNLSGRYFGHTTSPHVSTHCTFAISLVITSFMIATHQHLNRLLTTRLSQLPDAQPRRKKPFERVQVVMSFSTCVNVNLRTVEHTSISL